MVDANTLVQLILFISLCSILTSFALAKSMRWIALHFWLSLTLISGLFFSTNQILIGTASLFVAIFSFCLHLFYGLATEGALAGEAESSENHSRRGRIATVFYAVTAALLAVIVAIAFASGPARPKVEHAATLNPSGTAEVAGILMNKQFFSIFMVLLVGGVLTLCWSEILGSEQRFEGPETKKKGGEK